MCVDSKISMEIIIPQFTLPVQKKVKTELPYDFQRTSFRDVYELISPVL